MKTQSITETKSFDFALKIIKVYEKLVAEKHEYTLSKQLLRSGTSIGANVAEAIGGYSKNDFKFKISIAHKEARETAYWIKILAASQHISLIEEINLTQDVIELIKLLSSTLLTTKQG